MEDRLALLSATSPWAKSPDRLVADLDQMFAWWMEFEATLLPHLRELDGQGIAKRDGASSTAVWLRNRYLIAFTTAQRMVKRSAVLDAAPQPVQDAVAAAALNVDQAEAIVRSLADLPSEVDADVRALAAKELVRLAAELCPVQLATAGTAILHRVAPDVAEEADRTALERAEARAERDRGFTMSPDPGGYGVRLFGRLTHEGAAVVRAAIDPLCKPAHADTRTAGQRRADALVDVCRLALRTSELPANGGDRPQVVVNIPYDVLERELGPGTLDNGERVTPESARRIACDCRLLPIVFDGVGQPLDLGRSKRLINGPLRQALAARDHGCTFPGCDRGPRWTDAHHIVPWAAGGTTALTNLALLCGFHHATVHRPGGWTVHTGADGLPTFVPPRHLDPQQTPTRNRYHRRE